MVSGRLFPEKKCDSLQVWTFSQKILQVSPGKRRQRPPGAFKDSAGTSEIRASQQQLLLQDLVGEPVQPLHQTGAADGTGRLDEPLQGHTPGQRSSSTCNPYPNRPHEAVCPNSFWSPQEVPTGCRTPDRLRASVMSSTDMALGKSCLLAKTRTGTSLSSSSSSCKTSSYCIKRLPVTVVKVTMCNVSMRPPEGDLTCRWQRERESSVWPVIFTAVFIHDQNKFCNFDYRNEF